MLTVLPSENKIFIIIRTEMLMWSRSKEYR